VRDISDRKRAVRLQTAGHSITRIISKATSWDMAVDALLATLCTSLLLAVAEVWLLEEGGRQLNWGGGWHLPDVDLTAFVEAGRSSTFRRGEGLPGRVWAEAKPLGMLSIFDDGDFTRSSEARSHGLRSVLAFPLTNENRVVGVISLFGNLNEVDATLLEALGDIGQQLGQFLQRTRIEAELKAAQDQVRAGLEFQAFHCCCSTSMASSRSTIALATPSATRSSGRWPPA
jgi:GAF domain-containing protein